MGDCCWVLPLKLGCGLICMFHFAQSLLCILALMTGDIRFQGNGYNLHTYMLPSTVGALGVIFGFVGLLGVYHESLASIRAFNRFLVVKLGAMVITMVADYWELRKCDSWMETPESLRAERYDVADIPSLQGYYGTGNVPMDGLAKEQVCPWARWAYLIGFFIDFGIAAYFAYKCLQLEWQLQLPALYPIDFGQGSNITQRWLLFGVKDPRQESLIKPASKDAEDVEKMEQMKSEYGSLDDVQRPYQDSHRFGPDGLDAPLAPLPPPPPQESWQLLASFGPAAESTLCASAGALPPQEMRQALIAPPQPPAESALFAMP